MAITSAICNSFKQEILVGTHNFTASSGNAFKLAMYTSSQLSLNANQQQLTVHQTKYLIHLDQLIQLVEKQL